MAAPSITVVNSKDETINTWDAGVIQANNESAVLQIYVWNNRNGSTALSDLQSANITALDIDGGSNSDVVAGKWVKVNVPSVDGNKTTWTPVGGSDTKDLKGTNVTSGNTIKGSTNNGSKDDPDAKGNYCEVNLKVVVPVNATPGTKSFKMRINGYYV